MFFSRLCPPSVIASILVVSTAAGFAATARADDPWADVVVHYSPGSNPEADYTSAPNVALGPPERVTGENTPFGPFPGGVTMFASPYGLDEIVSIGAGGDLVVGFNEPVIDRPGADLIIFGNAFFTLDFANSTINGLAAEPGNVEVSADGVNWHPVGGFADALFPTQGYLDSGIFGDPIGTQPTDFLKPVNPSLTLADFIGKSYSEALALYDGSGGGAPIDISSSGLSSIQYVRVSLPAGTPYSTEIDAFAAVPEPDLALPLLLLAAVGVGRGRMQRRRPWCGRTA